MIDHIYSQARQGKQTLAHFTHCSSSTSTRRGVLQHCWKKSKEADRRQERNGNCLWRMANLSCLQISPELGMEGSWFQPLKVQRENPLIFHRNNVIIEARQI